MIINGQMVLHPRDFAKRIGEQFNTVQSWLFHENCPWLGRPLRVEWHAEKVRRFRYVRKSEVREVLDAKSRKLPLSRFAARLFGRIDELCRQNPFMGPAPSARTLEESLRRSLSCGECSALQGRALNGHRGPNGGWIVDVDEIEALMKAVTPGERLPIRYVAAETGIPAETLSGWARSKPPHCPLLGNDFDCDRGRCRPAVFPNLAVYETHHIHRKNVESLKSVERFESIEGVRPFLMVADFAKAVGVSRNAVTRWCSDGECTFFETPRPLNWKPALVKRGRHYRHVFLVHEGEVDELRKEWRSRLSTVEPVVRLAEVPDTAVVDVITAVAKLQGGEQQPPEAIRVQCGGMRTQWLYAVLRWLERLGRYHGFPPERKPSPVPGLSDEQFARLKAAYERYPEKSNTALAKIAGVKKKPGLRGIKLLRDGS